jgi:hypothetical protein
MLIAATIDLKLEELSAYVTDYHKNSLDTRPCKVKNLEKESH